MEHTIARSIRNVIVKFELSQKLLDIAVGTQNLKLGYKLARSGGGGVRGATMDMQYPRTQTYDRGTTSNDHGSINVANRNRGLGSAAPGGNRSTVGRDSNYDIQQSPYDKRQQDEIKMLGAALFDKGEIGIKDRWMGKRK